MDCSEFSDDVPGRLVPTAHGCKAFVPNPLPPKVTWTEGLVQTLSAAERTLGGLARLSLPNPYLLMRPLLTREAVESSQIEGTQASISQLLMFDLRPEIEQEVPDVREVANYVAAMEHGLKQVARIPMCLRLIREIHGVLLRGVRGQNRTPGKFRTTQVHIGSPGTPIREARFIPPPPGPELDQCLDAFEKYLHAPSDLPPSVRLALIHYQFEAIHPFTDGNGRVGRLLVSLLCCVDGTLSQPWLYLSPYFHKTRQEYYDRLLAVSQKGDWEGWITYFLRGIALEGQDALDRAERLEQLKKEYILAIRKPRSSSLLGKLVERLFAHPFMNVQQAANALKITPTSAQRHIQALVDAGILQEITGQRRNRVYLAEGVIKAVYEPNFSREELKGSEV